MKINFHTTNLNDRVYKRLINYFLYFTLKSKDFHSFYKKWEIDIYPSTQIGDSKFFDTQGDGVGGVTGMYHIALYLEDKPTNLIHDIFKATLRKNAMVISHELCHAMLIHKGRYSNKVKLRNDDWSGHKKGTLLAMHTAEVHDRHIEQNFKTSNIWFYDWKTFTAHYLRNIKTINIDDLV